MLEFSLFMENYVRENVNEMFNFNIIRFKYLAYEAEGVKKRQCHFKIEISVYLHPSTEFTLFLKINFLWIAIKSQTFDFQTIYWHNFVLYINFKENILQKT